MPSIPENYVAFYGNVKIEKAWCRDCDGYAFVIDDHLVCCNTRVSGLPAYTKRESEPDQRRRVLPASVKRAKLEAQHHRCFYCDRSFGSLVHRRGKSMRLRVHYDHMVPYAYSQDNEADNFVAACHVCNSLKHAFYFNTLDEAQLFLFNAWREKGYT